MREGRSAHAGFEVRRSPLEPGIRLGRVRRPPPSLADELGYDSIWTWDHLFAIFGDPDQQVVEGYTALAGMTAVTKRAQLGLLVGANTFRNPGVIAKSIVAIDHMSGGRAILGIGGAWFGFGAEAFGIDFGTGFGQRLDWMDEATGAIRSLLDGESVSSDGDGRYDFRDLHLNPLPVQDHLPIMIGGSGEREDASHRRRLRRPVERLRQPGDPGAQGRRPSPAIARMSAAIHEEIERTVGAKIVIRDTEAEARRVLEDLMEHNRTPMANIEDDETFWIGTADEMTERLLAYREIGFDYRPGRDACSL